MEYINVKFGRLTKYDMDKLKKNYENLSAIVLKINTDADFVSVMVFVPKSVEAVVERALKSLSFDEFVPGFRFEGTPADWLVQIAAKEKEISEEIERIRQEMIHFKKKYGKDIQKYYSRLQLEYKVEEVKSSMACTNEFFYMTGWIRRAEKQNY